MAATEETIILVKAWPQPSQKYGETVCCAGVTRQREWRRLFPIRFRHLEGSAQFRRWDIVEYRPERPRDDNRAESRRVDEPSLRRIRTMPESERPAFFDPLFRPSIQNAAGRGESLTLIRPKSLRFKFKRKSDSELAEEQLRRARTLAQGSLFDKELAKIEPCPFNLSVAFEDAEGPHEMGCGDWETAAAFFNLRRQYGEVAALEHLRETYEEKYFSKGVGLALGTVKKRPNQWLLLGLIRIDQPAQASLL